MASSSPAEGRSRQADALVLLAGMIALMWMAEAVDAVLGGDLDALGIEPRDDDGLAGVFAAPFLHAGFGHLVANTVPFALLGGVIAVGGARRLVLVTVIVALASGLGTWLVAPAGSVHIGASGLVFGYATYLLVRGLFSRSIVHLLVGVAVGALFGAVLLGGLVPREGISWQGHLFGAIGGVVAARLLPDRPPPASAR